MGWILLIPGILILSLDYTSPGECGGSKRAAVVVILLSY